MNSFFIDGDEIFVFVDPVHVLKAIRNALIDQHAQGFNLLLSEDFVKKHGLPSNEVSVKPLDALVNFQATATWKFAPRLSSKCLKLEHFDKMKVGPAKNLLSWESAVGIRYLIKHQNQPEAWETTAFFCERVAKWFDLVSSRKPSLSISLNNFEQRSSELNLFMEMIDGMQLSKAHCVARERKPLQRAVLLSAKSLIDLARQLLQKENWKFVMGGRFLGDAVENINSGIRYKNPKPTSLQTRMCVKCLTFLHNLKPPKDASYDADDENFWLTQLNDLKKVEKAQAPCDHVEEESEFVIVVDDVRNHAQDNARAYCNGYVLTATICRQSFCDECKNAWTCAEPCLEEHEFITDKSFKAGALVYPSLLAIEVFNMCESSFLKNQKLLETSGKLQKLVDDLESFVESTHVIPKCHLNLILRRWFKIRMFIHASEINSEMRQSQAKVIRSAANSSKTMKGKYV